MRVRAGELKGQPLRAPRGRTTRPTADQVRIACLDTLTPFLGRGTFLDLFAGAGSVGIEALSRGAPSAVFVEEDAVAVRTLRENLERLGLVGRARVMRQDAERALEGLARRGERFAAAFLDPPYGSRRALPTLHRLGDGACLLEGAVVVLQHATKSPPPPEPGILRVWKSRRFGETTLTFLLSHA